MFTINVIMTVIDKFQQLNLFMFKLLFYVIGDMSIKFIVKFMVSLTSFLKKKLTLTQIYDYAQLSKVLI